MIKRAIKSKPLSFAILSLCIFIFLSGNASAQEKEPPPAGQETPLANLKNETLSYFEPVAGNITAVEGNSVKINAGLQKAIKVGMRLQAFKEGVSFIHPVTKEPLGRVEMPIGIVEIIASYPDNSSGIIVTGKSEDFIDANVKVAGAKIKLLFYQGNVDWVLGESYYQMLKESGRFELIDTGIETYDTHKIISEAKNKNAEIALVLSSDSSDDRVNLKQKLFRVSDAQEFSEKSISLDISRVKELRFKAGMFGPKEGEILLSFQIPFNAKRLAVGDINGDGSPEFILASGNEIKVYEPGVDLKLLWEFTLASGDDVIWIDCADINKNSKDEIIVTSIQNDDVVSYAYELKDSKFVRLVKITDTFLKKNRNELIAQQYFKGTGYDGSVFSVTYADSTYKKGGEIKLPEGINIYDFQLVTSPDGRQAIFAWDENGYLNLYNDKGIRLWISKEDFGGFSMSFKKDSPTVMVDRGKWSVKDRLVLSNSGVLAPKRKPLLGMTKGLGYSSSEIKSLWWSGIGVEDRPFIENLDGEVLDYYPVGDRMVVLSKISLVMKATNIFKGKSPFGVMLYIYSTKGI